MHSKSFYLDLFLPAFIFPPLPPDVVLPVLLLPPDVDLLLADRPEEPLFLADAPAVLLAAERVLVEELLLPALLLAGLFLPEAGVEPLRDTERAFATGSISSTRLFALSLVCCEVDVPAEGFICRVRFLSAMLTLFSAS